MISALRSNIYFSRFESTKMETNRMEKYIISWKFTGPVYRVQFLRFAKSGPILFDLLLCISLQKSEILEKMELLEIVQMEKLANVHRFQVLQLLAVNVFEQCVQLHSNDITHVQLSMDRKIVRNKSNTCCLVLTDNRCGSSTFNASQIEYVLPI